MASDKQDTRSKWQKEYEKRVYNTSNGVSNLISQSKKDTNAQIDALAETQKKALDDQYKELARQAYVRRMQEQQNVAANVARSGKTGGFAQYTTAKPGETYGSALAQIEAQRLKEYGDVNLSAGQQKMNAYQIYANQAISQANNDRAYDYAAYRDLLSDSRYQTNLLYNQAQIAAQYGDYSKLKALGIQPDLSKRSKRSYQGTGGYQSQYTAPQQVAYTGVDPEDYADWDEEKEMIHVGGMGWLPEDAFWRIWQKSQDPKNIDYGVLKEGTNADGKKYYYSTRGNPY